MQKCHTSILVFFERSCYKANEVVRGRLIPSAHGKGLHSRTSCDNHLASAPPDARLIDPDNAYTCSNGYSYINEIPADNFG